MGDRDHARVRAGAFPWGDVLCGDYSCPRTRRAPACRAGARGVKLKPPWRAAQLLTSEIVWLLPNHIYTASEHTRRPAFGLCRGTRRGRRPGCRTVPRRTPPQPSRALGAQSCRVLGGGARPKFGEAAASGARHGHRLTSNEAGTWPTRRPAAARVRGAPQKWWRRCQAAARVAPRGAQQELPLTVRC
jgi:hypothetical protein